MSFQDTLRKNLTPELFDQVVDQLGDDFDYDLVPRARLNKVIGQRNDLRAQLAGTTPPQDPITKGKNGEDDGDSGTDIEELKKQLKAQSDKEIRDVKIQFAALEKLRSAAVIDPELVWSSNAIDKSKLDLDKDGKLTGMDEIITQLKKDKAHLFKVAGDAIPSGTGKDGGSEFEGVKSRDEFLKLPADKQIAFKQKNPEIFKTFMSVI